MPKGTAARCCASCRNEAPAAADEEVSLYNYILSAGDPLAGKTIRESGLREKAKALVVGIERGESRILNPESDTRFEVNDNVFIVGNRRRVKAFLQ